MAIFDVKLGKMATPQISSCICFEKERFNVNGTAFLHAVCPSTQSPRLFYSSYSYRHVFLRKKGKWLGEWRHGLASSTSLKLCVDGRMLGDHYRLGATFSNSGLHCRSEETGLLWLLSVTNNSYSLNNNKPGFSWHQDPQCVVELMLQDRQHYRTLLPPTLLSNAFHVSRISLPTNNSLQELFHVCLQQIPFKHNEYQPSIKNNFLIPESEQISWNSSFFICTTFIITM